MGRKTHPDSRPVPPHSYLVFSTLCQLTMADDAPKPSEVAHDPAPSGNQQKIDPWSVSGEVGEDGKVKAIDYAKLTNEFGTQMIDDPLLERFERVTGHKPHRFMRRQIVFSHRDLTTILDRYEKMSHSSCTRAEDRAVTAC